MFDRENTVKFLGSINNIAFFDRENATKFLDSVNNISFFDALERIKTNTNLMHSDRWSMIYDLLEENNYSTKGTIVTDLTYYIEEEM